MKKLFRSSVLLMLVSAAAFAGCGSRGSRKPSPQPPPPALRVVEFIVHDANNAPVPNPHVTLQGGTLGGNCDTTGNGDGYAACVVVPGSLTATQVTVSADGYADYSEHADLPPNVSVVVYLGDPSDGRPFDVHLRGVDARGPPHGSGIIRTDGSRSFVDDSGDILPVSLHLGDLFWRNSVDPASVDAILGKARTAGYRIIRSWAILNDRCDRSNPFWGYLCAGPRAMPDWKAQMVAFGKKLASYGLVWHLSFGGYDGLNDAELRNAYQTVADAIDEIGEANVIFSGEINEAFFNADHHGPAYVESLVNIIRARHPQNLYALSHVMGTEDSSVIKPWTPSWMTFYALGGSGRSPATAWFDLAHHNFGDGYEGPSTVIRRLWDEFEGDDRPDINAAQWGIIKAAVAIAHGVPDVFLPGSARLGRDGDPSNNPAFWSIPALINALPRDLSRFPSLEHIGDPAGRPWRRPVSNCGEGTRGEYARDPATGRFVLLVYLNGGRPGTYSCHVDNGFTATVIPPDHPDQAYAVDENAGQAFQFTTATGVAVSGRFKQ